jgi:hypothetical protein
MIRREDGDWFLLIAQHRHALLAGVMAEKFGNDSFVRPAPFAPTIKGVALHDCGWPLHDDAPTINRDGKPIDVFESTRQIALKVWTASADRASAEDPYAGLLTSLHVLSLSVFATSQTSFTHEKFDNDAADTIAVMRFQQHEIARQEQLRIKLGLRTDKPVHHGQARETGQKTEDQLTMNFRLLQAMDALSLGVCCTKPPSAETQDVYPKPCGTPVRLKMARRGNDLMVAPWPFAESQLELKIPATRVPNRAYANDDELRQVFAAAPAELITARLIPARVVSNTAASSGS